MPAERTTQMNEFIRDKHPGMVGIEVLTCEPHEVTGRLDVTDALVAGTGYLWAPVVITLADWLCACGTPPNMPDEAESFTTIELKVNFLGSVKAGGAIHARARPAHVGRTTQVWDVEVTNEATDKTICLFRCTQMILYPRA
ncbi:MAG: PaaI family thioesterase [Myxococcota bacterium]